MAEWKTLNLAELLLDQRNYRTGVQTNQRQAIRAIIDDQKDMLVNLAADLLDVGPSPGEPLWVVPETEAQGMFTVLEGNRRVAALKLMETPVLASDTLLEEQFKALGKRFAETPHRTLDAKLFDSRDDALPWIRRRHMTSVSRVGMQRWKRLARGRAEREQGQRFPRSLALFELLEDDTDEWASIAETLDNKWSTVDRVLDTRPLRSLLGVTIDARGMISFENGNSAAGKELLLRILAEMASPDFNFDQVEDVEDREKFLGKFSSLSVKAPQQKPYSAPRSAMPAVIPPTSPMKTKPPRLKADPIARNTLAPKIGTRRFPVNGVRLSAIYKECKNLEVKGSENAAALLLRVFIELSSETFLVEKKTLLPAEAIKKGKRDWDDIGIPLSTKVSCVLGALDPSGKGKAFHQIRVSLDPSTTSVSSMTTLHGYFHNRELKPEVAAIQQAWDIWEVFLSSLHNSR